MMRLIGGGFLALAIGGHDLVPLDRIGRLADPAIVEASGLVASRQHPGIFWVHNDSGNAPELFAVRRDGRLVRSYRVAAPNVDWEDIATDAFGHLYIADTGNNKLLLPLRVIYRLAEPDPAVAADPARALPVEAAYFYKYATDRRFDSEGLMIHDDQALLISKRRDGRPADVFRIPVRVPASPFRPLVPTRVGDLPGCVEPVTGAALASDGKRLAVVTDNSVRLYRTHDRVVWTPTGTRLFQEPNIEAIAWDGDDLALASEDRSLYRIPARWEPGGESPR